ncbi:YdbC family protein [Streptomyces sp. H10-C2]|uniref:YdbC family protein n=1 Tax=unclassified Streptomyces TaxID=2593676 RepID=UPI0024B9247D|nr:MULTISPECIES: YdbC family protein [unclassified Streptomyces]MDJ0341589.1 YdbC family protein [Streptomyces sp. PH10-H1]MDJ0371309.1 YdbC family protein [Streptomyces sp. H10-C2]
MLVKWIRCGVVDRAGFERGQRKWAGLRGEPGFRGQGGGWSRAQPGVAHLFAFWDSRAAYDAFMDGSHDRLAGSQAASYENLGVLLFEHVLDVRVGFLARFSDADLLRVAHSRVRPERGEHFTQMQQKVWNPAMAGSPGLLRGVFAQGSESDFLVLSMWDSANERGKYRPASVARLAERVELDTDVISVAGDLVDIVQAWTV